MLLSAKLTLEDRCNSFNKLNIHFWNHVKKQKALWKSENKNKKKTNLRKLSIPGSIEETINIHRSTVLSIVYKWEKNVPVRLVAK